MNKLKLYEILILLTKRVRKNIFLMSILVLPTFSLFMFIFITSSGSKKIVPIKRVFEKSIQNGKN